jgi:hypothetical protein
MFPKLSQDALPKKIIGGGIGDPSEHGRRHPGGQQIQCPASLRGVFFEPAELALRQQVSQHRASVRAPAHLHQVDLAVYGVGDASNGSDQAGG